MWPRIATSGGLRFFQYDFGFLTRTHVALLDCEKFQQLKLSKVDIKYYKCLCRPTVFRDAFVRFVVQK